MSVSVIPEIYEAVFVLVSCASPDGTPPRGDSQ